MPERILKPYQAAKIMGTNVESVRIRMQKGSFNPPIGTACQLSGSKYTYEIFPEKIAAYLNIPLEEVFKRLEEG